MLVKKEVGGWWIHTCGQEIDTYMDICMCRKGGGDNESIVDITVFV